MVNYQNSKIYKIINKNNEIIYIGSTTQRLSQRFQKHHHKAPNNKIILIENYSCNSKEELCMREQEIIEEHTNLLNKQRAYNSEEDNKQYRKEYLKNNQDKIKEIEKQYKKNNKNHISKVRKDHYENNKINYQKKVNCPHCNMEIQIISLKRHQKRNICLNFKKS